MASRTFPCRKTFSPRSTTGRLFNETQVGKYLSLTLILLILPSDAITSAFASNGMWRGSGTELDPYLITDKDELWALSDLSNSGEDLMGVYFLQTEDIDLGGEDEPWTPVSTTTSNGVSHQFTGIYDGGGHKITGMYVHKPNDDADFFGYIGKGAVIRYVNVIDGDVSGSYWASGITGRNYGIIEYCSFSGSVIGSRDFVGGIVGDNHTGGILRYCYTAKMSDGITETYVEGKQISGGIAGRNSTGSTIENCYNTAYVTTEDWFIHNLGGITGKNEGNRTVENCYNTGLCGRCLRGHQQRRRDCRSEQRQQYRSELLLRGRYRIQRRYVEQLR